MCKSLHCIHSAPILAAIYVASVSLSVLFADHVEYQFCVAFVAHHQQSSAKGTAFFGFFQILGFFPAFPKWAFALSSSKALCKVNTKSLLLINPKVLLQVNTSLNFSKKELSTIQSFFNINEPFGLPIYSEASFQYDNSGSHIGGIRGVFHFKKYSSVEFSMGGEAYFSMKDQIGGGIFNVTLFASGHCSESHCGLQFEPNCRVQSVSGTSIVYILDRDPSATLKKPQAVFKV